MARRHRRVATPARPAPRPRRARGRRRGGAHGDRRAATRGRRHRRPAAHGIRPAPEGHEAAPGRGPRRPASTPRASCSPARSSSTVRSSPTRSCTHSCTCNTTSCRRRDLDLPRRRGAGADRRFVRRSATPTRRRCSTSRPRPRGTTTPRSPSSSTRRTGWRGRSRHVAAGTGGARGAAGAGPDPAARLPAHRARLDGVARAQRDRRDPRRRHGPRKDRDAARARRA